MRLLFWLFGLAAVAVAALVAALLSLDPNNYKGWVEARVQERAGRTLSLAGDVAFTLYPWLGVTANKVTLGPAPGFGDAPFLSLDYLNVRVKTLPLLRNEYEIDTARARGVTLNLARNEQGVANWEDLLGRDKPKDDAPLLPLALITLGGVAVEDARVAWHDRQAGVRYDFDRINVSTGELRYGDPVDLELRFRGKSNKPAVTATARLTAAVTYALDERRYGVSPLNLDLELAGKNVPGGKTRAALTAVVDVNMDAQTAAISALNLEALGMTVKGDLGARRIESPRPGISAALDITGTDLALLFKVAEAEPLASQLARLPNRRFHTAITADADLERGDIDLSALSARLLGAVVTGEMKARRVFSAAPEYRGRLDAQGPNLPALMQVVGRAAGAGGAPLAEYGKKLAGHPQSAFKATTRFDADLKNGDVDIPAFSVQGLGVTARGVLAAKNMQGRKGTVRGKLDVKGADMARLLTALGQGGPARALQTVTLKTGVAGSRDHIALSPLSLDAVFRDKGAAPLPLVLDAEADINLDKETLAFKEFSLAGPGLKAGGNLRVSGAFSEPAFAGQIAVQPFNLRETARRMKYDLPPTADPKALTKVGLSGSFAGSAATLEATGLALRLDDTQATGDIRLAGLPQQPRARFNLEADAVNLDRYLPPESPPRPAARPAAKRTAPQVAPPGKKPPGKTLAAGVPSRRTLFRRLDLDGSLRIGAAIISGAKLTGFQTRVIVADGVMTIDPVAADLYQGELEGKAKLDLAPAVPQLALNAQMKGVHVGPLLKDATGRARLRGRGNVEMALTAAGNDAAAMKRSLDGTLNINLEEGALVGFNMGRALRQWKNLRKGVAFGVKETEATDFLALRGNPVVTAGVMRMDDLDLKAPAFRLVGNGVVADLRTDTIDYRLSATIANTSKGAGGKELADLVGFSLPISVTGPLDDPLVRLDWGDVLSSLFTKKLTGTVADVLRDAVDVLPAPAAGKPAPVVDKAAPAAAGKPGETGQGAAGGADKSDPADDAAADKKAEEPAPDPLRELLEEGLKGIFR